MQTSSNQSELLRFLSPYRIMITDVSPVFEKKVFGKTKTFGKVKIYGGKIEIPKVEGKL